ncbi:MAG: helix-turn-helix domain-containing protein [Planctomycetota bacterium]|jgi:transposase
MREFLTPPQVAAELGVKPHKVHDFIRAGELKASDLSKQRGTGRPRWKIARSDLQAFLDSRAAPKPGKPQRRARKPKDVETFY